MSEYISEFAKKFSKENLTNKIYSFPVWALSISVSDTRTKTGGCMCLYKFLSF